MPVLPLAVPGAAASPGDSSCSFVNAAGKPIPADVAQRVQDRAAQIREQVRQAHGVQDLAAHLIRESRGPLDDEQARELTLTQAETLRRGPKPWRLRDPETGEEFVLVPAADYERLVGAPPARAS